MNQLILWTKKFRFLLFAALALYATHSIPAQAQSPATDLYGVVEIGGKGVKASLIQLTANEARDIERQYSDEESNFKYELFGKSEKQSFDEINTNIALGQENIGRTVDAVQMLVKKLEEDGSIVRDNIFIVFSSSVARLDYQEQLARNIAAQTKIEPDAITPIRNAS
ncbi:MAG: hypothetical protein HC850_15110 [Rhodomicrobium sp.]|nr:hypothetical protein [Rhodomicrobium sp.]